MPLHPGLFKAYDIRGLSPEELDADGAYRIGQALVRFTEAQTVVVGYDMRDTTPMLLEAFTNGVRSQGADVVDIGMVTTPMLYFAAGEYELHDAGAMITASHNTKEYNGLKLCFGDVMPIGGKSGMDVVRDMAMAGPYPERKWGGLVTTSVKDTYFARLMHAADAESIGPLSVVVDTANGMEGAVIGEVFARVPQCRFEGMYLELDGAFPNHEANPLKEETLDALRSRVVEAGADVGVAFDGDGDRVGLVDEKGNIVRGDIMLALLAPVVLHRAPGSVVLYDVRSSWAVHEAIAEAGGVPEMCPVGHGLIKPLMRDRDAVFAGELSNHFYFRDFYGSESSDLVMLMTLALMSRSKKPLSELVAPLMRYHHSGEINFRVKDVAATMRCVREAYEGFAAVVSNIDGMRMEFRDAVDPQNDWWFSVRASNTEPLLRLNVEGKTREMMELKRNEVRKCILDHQEEV